MSFACDLRENEKRKAHKKKQFQIDRQHDNVSNDDRIIFEDLVSRFSAVKSGFLA